MIVFWFLWRIISWVGWKDRRGAEGWERGGRGEAGRQSLCCQSLTLVFLLV